MSSDSRLCDSCSGASSSERSQNSRTIGKPANASLFSEFSTNLHETLQLDSNTLLTLFWEYESSFYHPPYFSHDK